MYNKLITHPFINIISYQKPSIHILQEALNSCANTIPFSTFPYIFNQTTSKQALKRLRSGNCITLSYYIKEYLKHNHIKSYLIPATIPNRYKREGYLDIAHVAVAVPYHNNIIWILDPAFYFTHPMKITLDDYKTYGHSMSDIYNSTIDDLNYQLEYHNHLQRFNEYQHMPRDTYRVKTALSNDIDDAWYYYLREIKNPDKAISSFFINLRKHEPFITLTKHDNNRTTCELMIKVINNMISIKHNQQVIYDGLLTHMPKPLLDHLSKQLGPYFNNTLPYYLDINHITPNTIIF
tara:strand:+ start:1683 stop:2561 length:879 start_codon:yes stop_codon:yes gene_type:complete